MIYTHTDLNGAVVRGPSRKEYTLEIINGVFYLNHQRIGPYAVSPRYLFENFHFVKLGPYIPRGW